MSDTQNKSADNLTALKIEKSKTKKGIILWVIPLVTLLFPYISIAQIFQGSGFGIVNVPIISYLFRFIGSPLISGNAISIIFSYIVYLSPYICTVILITMNFKILKSNDYVKIKKVRTNSLIISIVAIFCWFLHLSVYRNMFILMRFVPPRNFLSNFVNYLSEYSINIRYIMLDQLLQIIVWIISAIVMTVWIAKMSKSDRL